MGLISNSSVKQINSKKLSIRVTDNSVVSYLGDLCRYLPSLPMIS